MVITNDEFENFELIQDGPTLSLIVVKALNLEILRSRYLSVVLKASKETDNEAFATILLDVESFEQKSPEFLKNVYEGTFEEDGRRLAIEKISLKPETFSADVVFSFSGESQDYLNFDVTGNEISVTVKESVEIEELLSRDSLRFVITASKDGIGSTTTNGIIKTIGIEEIAPKFEKDFLVGNLLQSRLTIANVLLEEETYEPGIVVTLEGDDIENFDIQREEREITISLKQGTQIDPAKKHVSFYLVAAKSVTAAKVLVTIIIEDESSFEQKLLFDKSLLEGSITDDFLLNLEKLILNEETFTEQVIVRK